MLKHTVPVDDGWHSLDLTCFHVADDHRLPQWRHVGVNPDEPAEVWLWLIHHGHVPPHRHYFRVYGTGQQIPAGAVWVGTAPAAGTSLIWHLFEYDAATFERSGEGL